MFIISDRGENNINSLDRVEWLVKMTFVLSHISRLLLMEVVLKSFGAYFIFSRQAMLSDLEVDFNSVLS